MSGYNVSYNDQAYKSESGSQDAGIYTITLTKRVKATPLFGAQQLNIKRDPSNKTQFPNLQGTITYGEQTTTAEGQLGGITSGQVVDFVSIPPAGHTTQWANRTGDTNGNGVLDYGEIHDLQTGELYRQFDYDGDGQLDAEYGDPMFGDLFGYKVNQPNPLFYYYYVPMTGQTIYSGKVTGQVKTREYTIRQGFTQVPDKRGKLVDKLVSVVGAAVKMGGSYDRANPDAQMGYGSSTNSTGYFEFNVANVVKNSNYLLGVDYNGVSYLDKINPSVTKELILPTFTSMEPLSIEAAPHGGEDKTVVAGSVVMVQDKDVDFNLITGSNENNVQVANAVFRVYSSNGTLASTTTVPVNVNKAVFTANLNEKFTPNARLTVQLVDQNGLQSMEFNTGFQFRPKMLDVAALPGFAAPGEPAVDLIESVMGKLDLGLAKFLGDNEAGNGESDIEITEDGYTLYLGIGRQLSQKSKTLKDTINKAVYGDSSAKNNIKSQNTGAKKKEDSNLKVKSTLNNKLGIKVSLQMSIKYDDTWTEADKDSGKATPYYFGDLMLIVTLEDTLSSETTVVLPVGISIIIKLDVGGAVTGFVYITPGTYFDMNTGKTVTKMIHADQNGGFPYFDSDKFDYEGGIILEPFISLTIGAVYGVAKVAVNGKATFYLFFSTGKSGNGTVTLNAKVTASVLGFEVYKKTFANWSTSLFGDAQAQVASMLDMEDLNQNDFKPVSRNYLNNRSGWIGDQPRVYMQSGTSGETDFTENVLMAGIYPDPDTQLMRIDGDSLLMVFVDDHPERSDANRGGIYYSVSHDNGATFSQPILIDDDGTLDSHPRLTDLGDRIMLLFSSMDEQISEEMDMEDILELHGLELAFFDKNTSWFSAPVDVTRYTGREKSDGGLLGDYHSDVNGNAVYDEASGQVMIMFTKTDYTSDGDEEFLAEDLFKSYGTVVYMLYDTNTGSFLPYEESDYPPDMTGEQKAQWDADWYGQRFLNTEISLPGDVLADPLVFDLTAKIKGRTAYIAYTVDMDGDLKTLDDRDIYLQTYSFADQTFSSPFKISDMQDEVAAKADGKPQLVLYKGDMHLFFHGDTAIYYYDLDTLFAELNSPDRPPVVVEDDPLTAENEHYSYDPDDFKPITPRVALEYSAENLPTDDYQVLVGDDGKLYLVWTEETVRLAEGVEPGSQESLKPENLYHEDQIFASVFFEKLDASKETAVVNHDYGKWSGKVQITAGPGSYDDPDMSVMANGHIILAAKKSEKVLVDDTPTSPREDHLDTAELVALTLTPIPQAEMKQDAITFATEYPLPGEITTITATAGNHGLMPLLSPAVDFYAVQGETETLIDTVYNSAPVYGGYESTFSVPWKVPENIQDIKIRAKLRSGGKDTAIAQAEKDFPYGTKLEYSMFTLDYVAQNYYRSYIEVLHTGNQPLENGELVISRIDTANVPHELKRVSISDATAALEMFVINEGFEVPHKDLTESGANIEVRIEMGGSPLVNQTGRVEKIISGFDRGLLDQATGVEMPYTALSLTSGWKSKITAKVYPAEAVEKNSIVYVSSNPGVAAVDDAGVITALSSGSATITAYAVPKVDVSIQTTDGYVVPGNIMDSLALEDCKSISLTVTVMDVSSDETPAVPAGDKDPGVPAKDEEPSPVDINANSNTPVSITEQDYKVEIGQKAIAEILKGEQNGTLSISVKAMDTTEKVQMYAISAEYKDTPLTSLNNAEVKVSIPYTLKDGENPNALVVYSVTDKGELKANPGGRYENGMVTFSTSDLTNFGIGYNPVVFADVNKSAGYADAITFITARGIAEGTGDHQFAPEKLMTRQEFAKVIALAYGFTWSGEKTGFTDVSQNSWYQPYVGALYEAGIINGRGDGKFGTGQYITRQEMAKIMYAALQKSGTVLNKTRDYNGFSDDNTISKHTAPAIKTLYEAGILGDAGNNELAPTAGVTRSDMAEILKTALELN